MASPEKRDSVAELDDKLKAMRKRHGIGVTPAGGGKTEPGALGAGLDLAIELVVAFSFSIGLGWFLDRQFGTAPALVLVFFFLGIGAAAVNVNRALVRLKLSVGFFGLGGQDDKQ